VARVTFDETSAGGQAPSPGAAAYACSRLGLRVFPLVPGTGTPALKAWPDYATTDVDQIREWWTWDYPGYGVGIACGPESGVWVLDIDMKKGVDGFASLLDLRLARREYDMEPFTRTMVVTTPSGGAHMYFRWTEGVVNSTSRIGPGLDVRADHGYVRAPGWGGYDIVSRGGERNVRIFAAPEWLASLAYRRKSDARSDALRTERPGTSWAKFSASATLRTLGSAPEGTRNTQLNKAAYKMGLSGSMTESDAWEACQRVLVSMGAGDDMPAWRRTFESGWNAGCERRLRA
jgi:hypothetical protein